MKKSKPQQALLCQSIKRSGGTTGALIMRQTQEERGAGSGGRESTPAHGAHKKTLTHRCKDIVCKCVDMDILCMHNHTHMHARIVATENAQRCSL